MQTTQGADKAARPVALEVEPGGIPAELKQLKRWVLWRYEWSEEKQKWDKPPLGPLKGHRTSVQRPGGWGTFNVALAGLESKRGKAVGIGFVLSSGPDDPLDLIGIDIDDPALIPLLAPLATYTEGTPTAGKGGARALFRGKLPEGHTCRAPGGGAEAYESGRYFTVTGRRLGGSPAGLARPDPGTLAAVLRSLGLLGAHPPPAPPPPVGAVGAVGGQTSRHATPCRVTLDPQSPDDVLLQTAYRARNGAEIRRLMDGDWSGYASQSDADQALCNHLEFYFRDEQSIDRVFRTSGLMRPKWDVVHYANGETYGQHTIRDAIKTGGPHYGDRRRTANGEALPSKAPTTPTAPTAPTGGGGAGAGAPPSANGHAPAAEPPLTVSAAGIRAVPLTYLWDRRLPAGKVALLDGKKGVGKSTLLAAVVADLTGGPRLPGASAAPRPQPLQVVYVPGEEHIAMDVVPRLLACGADMNLVHFFGCDGAGDVKRRLLLRGADSLGPLAEAVTRHAARLVVIDPFRSVVPGDLPMKDEQAMADVLTPLQALAGRLGFAVLATRNVRKASGPAIDAGLGSAAIGNIARTVLLAAKDSEKAGRFVLAVAAVNHGRQPPALYYRIAERAGAGVIRWEGEAEIDADDLAADQADAAERGAYRDGVAWLREALAGGWTPISKVKAALGDGLLTPKQLRTAREKLNVRCVARRVEGERVYGWELPPDGGWPPEEGDR